MTPHDHKHARTYTTGTMSVVDDDWGVKRQADNGQRARGEALPDGVAAEWSDVASRYEMPVAQTATPHVQSS